MKRLNIISTAIIFASLILMADLAIASQSGSGLPWEQPLTQIANSLKGKTATAFAILGIVGCGASWIFFEVNKAMRWFLGIVIGVSIIVAGTNIFSMLGISTSLM